MDLSSRVKELIRNIPDYPSKGIQFKDITPVLAVPGLMDEIAVAMAGSFRKESVEVVAAIEARGFILGALIARELGCSFVPIRKAGKLPYRTKSQAYSLEYGSATIEMHEDAIPEGARVVIHDDLLATGGTAIAAGSLVSQFGGQIQGYSFLINLSFLGGDQRIMKQFGVTPRYLVNYEE